MKTKRPYRNIFTIALILDFTSPLSPRLIHAPFTPIKRFALYPFGTKSLPSGCSHVNERFLDFSDLREWSASLAPNSAQKSGVRPLAQAIRKVRFDILFNLHPINQVLVNVPGGDSCGENICEALHELEATLAKQARTLDLIAVSPLNCKLAKPGPITLHDARKLSAEEIIALTKNLALEQAAEAETGALQSQMYRSGSPPRLKQKPLPLKRIPPNQVIVDLTGPPVRIQFSPGEKNSAVAQSLRVPGGLKLTPGNWKITLASPSWVRPVAGVEISLKPGEIRKLSVENMFAHQVTWFTPEKKEDVLILFEQGGKPVRLLVPAGSASVPFPLDLEWRAFPAVAP